MALPPLQYETITNYAPAIRGSGNFETIGEQSVEIVRGWTGFRVTPGLTLHDGRNAIRLIPDSASNNQSYVKMDIPSELRDSGVFRATFVVNDELTGSLNEDRGKLVALAPKQTSDQIPNEVGVYQTRVDYASLNTTPYEARIFHGGLLGSGEVVVLDIGLFDRDYDGKIFDGDTPPFFYKDQIVYPMWDGVPGESTSSFNFYDYTKSSPKLNWGNPDLHFFENGVDRGVLYVKNDYGVAWPGLVSVSEESNMSSPTALFVDGEKFNQVQHGSDFSASITAYSAPENFSKCDGVDSISNGLFVTEQRRVPFDISYRTKVGSASNTDEHHYKIHLVYNCIATRDNVTYNTISNTPAPIVMGWKISTVPVQIPGRRSTAHIVVDSRYTPSYILKTLEDILYGSPLNEPSMPTMQDLIDLFNLEVGD